MSINYWKLDGKQTEYLAPNFMPTDSSFNANLPLGLTYVVTAKARSKSLGVLRYTSFEDGVNEGVLETQLTRDWQTITNTWTETKTGRLFIKDRDGNGDIEIKDITVVEKPVPIVTGSYPKGKNLFNPSLWANMTINGGTGVTSSSLSVLSQFIVAKPSADYTVTAPVGYSIVGVYEYKLERTFISRVLYSGTTVTHRTTANTSEIAVVIRREDSAPIAIAELSNSTVQIEEGTIATEFQPFFGSKFKPPIKSSKNKIKPYGTTNYSYAKKESGWILSAVDIYGNDDYGFTFSTPVQYRGVGYAYFIGSEDIGKQAVFSSMNSGISLSLVLRFFNSSDVQISQAVVSSVGGGLKRVSATIPVNTSKIHVFAEVSTINMMANVSEMQLEINDVGYIGTSFEKYKETSKESSKVPRISGQNMIRGLIQDWYGNWSGLSTIERLRNSVRVILNNSVSGTSALNHINFPLSIVDAKTYTVSYEARANRNGVLPNYNYLMKGGASGGNKNLSNYPTLTTEWARYEQTVLSNYTVSDAYIMLGLAMNNNQNGDWIEFRNVQFEDALKSSLYVAGNKPSLRGLEFDGAYDGLQLPTLTMDSIEFDCIIDSAQAPYSFLFDCRNINNTQFWVSNATPNISSNASLFLDGVSVTKSWSLIPKDRRVKVKAVNNVPVTAGPMVWSNLARVNVTRGVLFGVKCYLNNEVVLEIDFTKSEALKTSGLVTFGKPKQLNRQPLR